MKNVFILYYENFTDNTFCYSGDKKRGTVNGNPFQK